MTFPHFVFWLKNRLFRHAAMAQYREALHNERLSVVEFRRMCWEKRVDLVHYAYETVPFYREYYDAHGFHPDQLKTEADWQRIPPLEKHYVREQLDRLLSTAAPLSARSTTTTGGSTGKPLKVYRDKRHKLEILGWRAFTWWNISPADNTGITHRRVPIGWKAKLKNQLLWWPTKRAYLSATSITDTDLERFTRELREKRIVWLTGYVGALECVADYILRNNIEITTMKMVWSTSAPLSDAIRAKLEQAFRCKVMNQYGSCEVSNIAQQCPHSPHLHINADFVHVDVVDENNCSLLDKEGDILVTDLTNRVAPLIRYRLGDRGCLLSEPCSCGISLPLMKSVKGRISDGVYTPDNVYIDGNYLTTIFDNYSDQIEQFQVRQALDYSLSVLVRPRRGQETAVAPILDAIQSQLLENVQHKLPVEIKLVDEIKADRGKIRYIISEITLQKYAKN